MERRQTRAAARSDFMASCFITSRIWHTCSSSQTRRGLMHNIVALVAFVVCVFPCSSMTQEQTPRISRIEFRPATTEEGGGMMIALLGSGRCSYTINFGDGKSEERTAQLPGQLQHTYPGD